MLKWGINKKKIISRGPTAQLAPPPANSFLLICCGWGRYRGAASRQVVLTSRRPDKSRDDPDSCLIRFALLTSCLDADSRQTTGISFTFFFSSFYQPALLSVLLGEHEQETVACRKKTCQLALSAAASAACRSCPRGFFFLLAVSVDLSYDAQNTNRG